MPQSKFFMVRSKLSDKVLDIPGSSDEPGTEICLWDEHGGDNQLWYVDHVKGVIRSKCNDLCLMVNENNRLCIQEVLEHRFNELWTLAANDTIQHTHFKERVFDVVGNNADNGAEVCTWEEHGGDNQKWEFSYVEPQYFMIVSEMNEKCLDAKGGSVEPETQVIMWEKHGGDNQLWYEDKYGVVRTKVDDLALDLFKEPGKGVRLGNFKIGLTGQMWGFSEDTLVNFARPDICLDIKNSDDSDGAKVIAWEYHGNDNQKWKREYVD